MPKYRSATTTHGRNMAGARALWRATGVKEEDFGKPIIAVVNSFTQFVSWQIRIQLHHLVGKNQQRCLPSPKRNNTACRH